MNQDDRDLKESVIVDRVSLICGHLAIVIN